MVKKDKNSTIKGLTFDEATALIFNIGSQSIRKESYYYILQLIQKVHAEDPKWDSILKNEWIDGISKDILNLLYNASTLPDECKLSIRRGPRKEGFLSIFEAGNILHRIKDEKATLKVWRNLIKYVITRDELRMIVQNIQDGMSVDESIKSSCRILQSSFNEVFVGAYVSKNSAKKITSKKYDTGILGDFLINLGIVENKEGLEELSLGLGDNKFVISGNRVVINKIKKFTDTIESEFDEYVKGL